MILLTNFFQIVHHPSLKAFAVIFNYPNIFRKDIRPMKKIIRFVSVLLFIFIVAGCADDAQQVFPFSSPAITSANNTTFTEGQAGTFTVTATGWPAPVLSLTGTLPSGVTFNPSTGILSGTPDAGTRGSYSLTITASNIMKPNATQTFILTVVKYEPGKYVYVNNEASPNYVSGFSINADGTLTELSGSPYLTGGDGEPSYYGVNPIAVAPVKGLLFASNLPDSTVSVFSINKNNGTLTLIGTPVASGTEMRSGGALVVSPDEKFLFVGNDGVGSSGISSISVFIIAANGTLTPVTGSPFNVGTSADGISLNLSGNILYVTDPDAVTLVVLSVANDGSLTPITGSPFAYPVGNQEIASFTLCSSTLGVAGGVGGIITSFSIDATGAPAELATLVTGGSNNNQSVITIRNGSLAVLSGGSDPFISVINVAASDGALTPVTGSPFATNQDSTGFTAVNPDGTFLYAAETTQIEAFSIAADGALTSIGTYPLTNPGDRTRGIVLY